MSGMADKPNLTAAQQAELDKEREIKELTTKLRRLSPLAKAEVVNGVLNQQVSRQLSGFTNFLRDQSVIGIGIGLVLGSQLKTVVDSVNLDIVQPLTTLFLPHNQSLANQAWDVYVPGRGTIALKWGDVLNSLLTFIIVAIIVYAIFRLFKLDKLAKK